MFSVWGFGRGINPILVYFLVKAWEIAKSNIKKTQIVSLKHTESLAKSFQSLLKRKQCTNNMPIVSCKKQLLSIHVRILIYSRE